MNLSFNIINKKIFPSRKKFSNQLSWGYPISDALRSTILQQEQIAYGQNTEKVFGEVLKMFGGVILSNSVSFAKWDRNKNAIIDHVVELPASKQILVIEQKLKDNHDSTKNEGQCSDLLSKSNAIKAQYASTYPGYEIIPVMFYLVDTQHGSKKSTTERLSAANGAVCYGKEFFDTFFPQNADEAWSIVNEKVLSIQRHTELIINLDNDYTISETVAFANQSKRNRNRVIKVLNDPLMENILKAWSSQGEYKEKVLSAVNYQLPLFK